MVVAAVTGVADAGKTAVGTALARRLDLPYAEADEFHPPASVARMSPGVPLTDEDRWPWLRAIGGWIARHPGGVVTCSALKRRYRDLLRSCGRPGSSTSPATARHWPRAATTSCRCRCWTPSSPTWSRWQPTNPVSPSTPANPWTPLWTSQRVPYHAEMSTSDRQPATFSMCTTTLVANFHQPDLACVHFIECQIGTP